MAKEGRQTWDRRDHECRQLVSAVVLLQRRMNQLERRLEQIAEDMVSMIEDINDNLACHKETAHG